ncbi:MAG: hypothetical protein Q4B68_09625 [Bacteroidales bacterium]|nr:hypothetical protein [Bacteroidales bacterium]
MKHISINPSAASFCHNEEAAPTGEAAHCVNLRHRERCLRVVGQPVQVATVAAGHRIIASHEGHYVSACEGDLFWHGARFHHTDAEVVNAHSFGELLVVVTEADVLHFSSHGGVMQRLDMADAVPELHLAAIATGTVTTDLPSVYFNTPLSYWRAPLPSADVRTLAQVVRSAYAELQESAASNGEHLRPMLVRYAVKMVNGQYAWMSAPVMLGINTIQMHYRVQAEALSSGGEYQGISAASLSLPTFKIGVSVLSGVAQQWAHLVKSIDILATDEVDIASTAQLDYRISTTTVGTRRYVAEYGPKPRSKTAVMDELMAGKWRVIASCTHIAALANHEFNAWGASRNATSVVPGIAAYALEQTASISDRLTLEQCAAIVGRSAHQHLSACSMSHGGRLYMGGGRERLVDTWRASAAMMPPFSASPCTVSLIERIATSQGEATLVQRRSYAFTPAGINPLLCAPHDGATSLRIEISASDGTKAVERDLSPIDGCAFAACFAPDLRAITPQASTASSVATRGETISAPGLLSMSALSLHVAIEQRQTATGTAILGIAAAERPIYSGGFGRYPIYIFTQEGIMVVPQSAKGLLGEAKLMSRKTMAATIKPIAGGGKVWWMSAGGWLCYIEGSKIKEVMPCANVESMAWNDAEHEIWLKAHDGSITIANADGLHAALTLKVDALHYSATTALATTASGEVLDITTEQPAKQAIRYLSHPFTLLSDMSERIERIIWNVFGNDLHLRLTLLGERGSSCHGFILCKAKVNGNLGAPVSLPLISQPARSARLEIEGTAPSGTIILPTDVYINTPH